jgi:hypothetical protein
VEESRELHVRDTKKIKDIKKQKVKMAVVKPAKRFKK